MRSWPATLQHDRIKLRPIRYRDQTAWRNIRRQNADWLKPWDATLPEDSGSPMQSFVEMVMSWRAQARDGRMMPFAIEYDNHFVGQVTVSGIVLGAARWAEIGYWIDNAHAGRNIMPISVALVCDHLFQTARLHRVQIAIRPENANSLRVVSKLGFTKVGFAPGYLHINGQWADHEIFQLLTEDVPEGVLNRFLRSQ